MNTSAPRSGPLPTPPQTPTEIASLWRRLAAMLYDSFLVIAIWIVVVGAILSAFGIEQARTIEGDAITFDPLYQYLVYAAMFISAFLFFGFFWTHSGQTLGMQAWRIKVQNVDGSAISWLQALLRFCSAPFALLALGLGYLYMLVDKERRTLPDIVSGSQVVRIWLP